MLEPGAEREIRNVMEYSSGLIVCLDQNLKRIDELYGQKADIIPRLRKADLSKARIKRKVQRGTYFEWEFISHRKFLDSIK
jgi:hypothetical protein